METEFAEAFLHRQRGREAGWSGHRVLGQRLRAFSLWHEFVLEFIDSPLVRPVASLPREVAAEALARAVRICRSRFGEADVRPLRGVRVAWRLAGKGLEAEIAAFRDYVRDYQVLPAYSIVPPRPSAASTTTEDRGQPPELLKMVCGVMAVTHCTRAEAWEMPAGEARWYYAMSLRTAGADLDFDTEAAREERARVAAEDPALHARLLEAARQFRTGEA